MLLLNDLPFFTTDNGVASLILKKIPFTKEAYVHIRDTSSCDALLRECVDVCRMAGAEKVYATGHAELEQYPLFCHIFRYEVSSERIGETDAIAVPVSREQSDWWRQVYNKKMAGVPAASPLSLRDVETFIGEGKAFYICKDCSILGIGVAFEGEILAVASLLPGAGRDVVLALSGCLSGERIRLTVAGNNAKACSLYQAIGFAETGKEASWYKIFPC